MAGDGELLLEMVAVQDPGQFRSDIDSVLAKCRFSFTLAMVELD